MKDAPKFTASMWRVLRAQAAIALILIALALAATLILSGADALGTLGLSRALGLGYGALLGALATAATARGVLQSSRAAASGRGALALAPIYAGLLLKFAIVAAGAFAALAYLGLGPLYVILGYLAMQIGYAWAGDAKADARTDNAETDRHRDST